MSTVLPKKYDFKKREEHWREFWDREKIYQYCHSRLDRESRLDPQVKPEDDKRAIFSVDTPPPYVSASHLHIGHIMSYSQAEFIVRYKRMAGYNVFYPMGFDDNGLPTERFVEQKYKVDKSKITRSEFIKLCLQETKIGAQTYKNLWRLLGISVDWSKTYSTINEHCQRISQWSFIDLCKKKKVVRKQGPIYWCPKCQTALAQADLEDKTEKGFLNYIVFVIASEAKQSRNARAVSAKHRGIAASASATPRPPRNNNRILITTTRPELLGACVALYFNPKDKRYQHLKNKKAIVPLFNYQVPIKTDKSVDPDFGTGIMMVCTWGDKDDIIKWQKDKLDTRIFFDEKGNLTNLAGKYKGLSITNARKKIIQDLKKQKLLKKQEAVEHSLNVHERCGTIAEFIQTKQWFIKLLDAKKEFLKRGRQLKWYPQYMRQKYEDWVKNLQWDWCISRQRYYGVPFPLWYCSKCDQAILAQENDLPVDPLEDKPPIKKCLKCGAVKFRPETDVMDTWMTSSLTPIIISELVTPGTVIPAKAGIHIVDSRLSLSRATRRGGNDKSIYPTMLRPQAFEIIRTWLFYTVVKSHYHHNHLPFKDVMISGHGLDPQGRKISKRLGNFEDPEKIINQNGADALRYWATGANLGENLRYNQDEVKKGKRTVTKIFNAARFALSHLENFRLALCHSRAGGNLQHGRKMDFHQSLSRTPIRDRNDNFEPVDKWILHHLAQTLKQATKHFENYEYAKARDVIDNFFWHLCCDNYLEFIKYRLYGKDKKSAQAAKQTLFSVMLNILKLYAPILPFITEEIYQAYFKKFEKAKSIHLSVWPRSAKNWSQPKKFLNEFDRVLNLIDNIRKYKSEKNLSLGQEVKEFRAKAKLSEQYTDFAQKAMRVKKIIS